MTNATPAITTDAAMIPGMNTTPNSKGFQAPQQFPYLGRNNLPQDRDIIIIELKETMKSR